MNRVTMKESLEKYLKGQIQALKSFKTVIEGLKDYEELKKFDGKVINKRIKDCIREYGTTSGARYVLFREYEYKDNTFILDISVERPEGETYKYKITTEERIYDIVVVDNKRFCYDNFITALDKKLEYFNTNIVKLEEELKTIDSIIEEFDTINKSIDAFQNKYSYYIRQGMKFQ